MKGVPRRGRRPWRWQKGWEVPLGSGTEFSSPGKGEANIVDAEPKEVEKHAINLKFPVPCGNDIHDHRPDRIVGMIVGGTRLCSIAITAGKRLQCRRCAQQMAGHRFGGNSLECSVVLPEGRLDG